MLDRSTHMRILATILLFAIIGCGRREGLPVQFVVPDGYRGVFSVTIDSTSGIAVPVTNGQFIVTIPASGKLRISSSEATVIVTGDMEG